MFPPLYLVDVCLHYAKESHGSIAMLPSIDVVVHLLHSTVLYGCMICGFCEGLSEWLICSTRSFERVGSLPLTVSE